MEEAPIRHDYTKGTSRNGWAIMDFEFLTPVTAKIIAFGLKRDNPRIRLEEKYLLPGEEVVISMPGGDVLYEISKITYQMDPYDMYEAELNYIQHLTGLRIMRQNEKRQKARQIEWGSHLERSRQQRI